MHTASAALGAGFKDQTFRSISMSATGQPAGGRTEKYASKRETSSLSVPPAPFGLRTASQQRKLLSTTGFANQAWISVPRPSLPRAARSCSSGAGSALRRSPPSALPSLDGSRYNAGARLRRGSTQSLYNASAFKAADANRLPLPSRLRATVSAAAAATLSRLRTTMLPRFSRDADRQATNAAGTTSGTDLRGRGSPCSVASEVSVSVGSWTAKNTTERP